VVELSLDSYIVRAAPRDSLHEQSSTKLVANKSEASKEKRFCKRISPLHAKSPTLFAVTIPYSEIDFSVICNP